MFHDINSSHYPETKEMILLKLLYTANWIQLQLFVLSRMKITLQNKLK